MLVIVAGIGKFCNVEKYYFGCMKNMGNIDFGMLWISLDTPIYHEYWVTASEK